MTKHGLTEEDTWDRDTWRNLVLGEGKPLLSRKVLRWWWWFVTQLIICGVYVCSFNVGLETS
jgi:hypothetical protein